MPLPHFAFSLPRAPGMQTGWAETHLTFNCAAKPPDGGPGGHSGLDLAAAAGHQPACGPAEARALSIKGTGVSLWRGKKIPFTVRLPKFKSIKCLG